MKLKVLKSDDTMLRRKCLAVTPKELRSKNFQNLIDDLLNFVYGDNNKGITRNKNKAMTVGLSANQVGIDKRISIVDLAIGRKGFGDIHVLINPEIIWQSRTKIEKDEGCVNLPNIWGYVKRSKRIIVKALDRSGNIIQLDLKGWPAILLQHEIGHLSGELFIDKLEDPMKAYLVKPKDYKKYKKLKKNWDKFIDISNIVI